MYFIYFVFLCLYIQVDETDGQQNGETNEGQTMEDNNQLELDDGTDAMINDVLQSVCKKNIQKRVRNKQIKT